MPSHNQVKMLVQQNLVAGICFVHLHDNRTTLDVYFFQHDSLPKAKDIVGAVTLDQIVIFSSDDVKGLPDIKVNNTEWVTVGNFDVLRLSTVVPSDFSDYRLKVSHPNLDAHFNDVAIISGTDRLQRLFLQKKVTGIDFVYAHKDAATLDVFFLRSPAFLDNPLNDNVARENIHIYSPFDDEKLPRIEVDKVEWGKIDERHVMRLITKTPGDFSLYRLRIDDERVDRYFNDVAFTFRAHCASGLDCAPDEPVCPPADLVDYPVDYRARDFNSFRRALLDFANQRYPDWQDRIEADLGVMLVEVMSALGDELAYYQDRIAREAYLETATQRRSLRHHARLVDYEMHNGLAGSTWLDVTVKANQSGDLLPGMDVWAVSDSGKRISFEVGRRLADRFNKKSNGVTYKVAASRNVLNPHIWDEDDFCLAIGATELFVEGKQKDNLAFDDPPDNPTGKWVLLQTIPKDPSVPERRWQVRLNKEPEEIRDLVFNEDITRLQWGQEQALPFELNLKDLQVRANLVPATAGRTVLNRFTIGVDPSSLPLPEAEKRTLRQAVERTGANGSVTYLLSLTAPLLQDKDKGKKEAEVFLEQLEKPEGKSLTWLGSKPLTARPELRLVEIEYDGTEWVELDPWHWRRSLLGKSSSQPADRHFTLEDGTWDRVVGYWRSGQEIVHVDYVSNDGFTIRFGDGEFGLVPAKGEKFAIIYRLGNGRKGNVSADAITHFDFSDTSLGFIESITNPLAVEGGHDPETPTEVRQLAPEAFRHLTYRAVRPQDYAKETERLPWVQRAGAKFRWTGSWLTLFATPDPLGAVAITDDQRAKLVEQLDRVRQAGRDVYVTDPHYADLDLKITVCVEPFAYQGEVKEAVLGVLSGTKGINTQPGFFSADNFTFGTPLKRSALEAVIQAVPGVRAVETISIRRRGWFDWSTLNKLIFEVNMDEVIRVENDPIHPARGSVKLIMEGGA